MKDQVNITVFGLTSSGSTGIPRGFKKTLLQTLTLMGLAQRPGNWQISLVRDRAMKALHQQTMNLPTTTDVMTFNLSSSPVTNPRSQRFQLDLDTVICVDEAKRQAKLRGHSIDREIILYAIHSLLHVCGYDDLTPRDAARMHRREDELLTALGIGTVYAITPATAPPKTKPRRRLPA